MSVTFIELLVYVSKRPAFWAYVLLGLVGVILVNVASLSIWPLREGIMVATFLLLASEISNVRNQYIKESQSSFTSVLKIVVKTSIKMMPIFLALCFLSILFLVLAITNEALILEFPSPKELVQNDVNVIETSVQLNDVSSLVAVGGLCSLPLMMEAFIWLVFLKESIRKNDVICYSELVDSVQSKLSAPMFITVLLSAISVVLFLFSELTPRVLGIESIYWKTFSITFYGIVSFINPLIFILVMIRSNFDCTGRVPADL